MFEPDAVELSALGACLALSAVETQRLFDQQYDRDLAVALPAAKDLAAMLGPAAALSVMPARMKAQLTEFTVKLELSRSRAFGFSLMVKPINLGIQITRHKSEYTDSEIRIEVEQVPAKL